MTKTKPGVGFTHRKPALRRALLRWFHDHRRDLPWRRTKSPYAIWVSEVMLQQTRVDTVVPYFRRFLRRFPSIRSLARADLDDVLALWQGLGYYARARHLHAGARAVVARHGGRVPVDRAARLALPGVGRYTAGAIGSIAFGLPEPVLDGNVERVLCRILGIRQSPRDPAVRERLWSVATDLAQGVSPGDLNQSLMELGALVCVPDAPRCGDCPASRLCISRREGTVDRVPALPPRKPPRLVRATAFLVTRGVRWLVVRRAPGGLLGGFWELPFALHADRARAGKALGIRPGRRLARVEHVFTHRRLLLSIHEGTALDVVGRSEWTDVRWVTPWALARLPLSALGRKVIAALR